MRELGLVGLSKDGKFLIARDPDSGDKFQIRADDRLKAVATTDRVHLGQLEINMESSLNPRDIQTRIRRGESPEAVADAAGVDVDRIIGY
ncbi:MAG TPA: septation protein SepH, partial [Aeromicrobium sp.]|nr:septation protein SepH [Aeromicrobium sp.]